MHLQFSVNYGDPMNQNSQLDLKNIQNIIVPKWSSDYSTSQQKNLDTHLLPEPTQLRICIAWR